uniref:receptor protein-tyrosine kinase n=1 Tax=Leptobrachium leishanense TaxID=445787 RepID=A0A8C5PSE2_9ANUR
MHRLKGFPFRELTFWLQVAVILNGLSPVINQDALPTTNCYLRMNSKKPGGRELKNMIYLELSTEQTFSPVDDTIDLQCNLNSENVYEAAVTVEINLFESVKLEVVQNISGTVSSWWKLRQNNAEHIVKNSSDHGRIIFLDLVRVTEKQAGKYELSISNGKNNYLVHFAVKIKSKPRKPYITESGKWLNCISESYPTPSVDWFSCKQSDGRCKHIGSVIYQDLDIYGVTRVSNKIEAYKLLDEYIVCCANNTIGKECTELYTVDLGSQSFLPEIILKIRDPFVMRCRYVRNTYMFSVKWDLKSKHGEYRFDESKHADDGFIVRASFISFPRVEREGSETYSCVSGKFNKSATVTVLDKGFIDLNTSHEEYDIDKRKAFCLEASFKAYPAVRCSWIHGSRAVPCNVSTTNGISTSEYCDHKYVAGDYEFYIENEDLHLSKMFTLNILQKPEVINILTKDVITCEANGYPLPTWIWKRDTNNSFNCTEHILIGITHGAAVREPHLWKVSSSLVANPITNSLFVCCCATNSAGTTCDDTYINHLEVKSIQKEEASYIYPVSVCTGGVLIVILIALIFSKYKKQYKYENQLQMIQFIGPSDNEYIYIDLRELKYDLKWEFPRENLQLGDVLGSGAFGKVVTAAAYGITKPGVSLQVAVKMLKENPDFSEKEALMSELKMMTQIGHHKNIVNLLGACTNSGPVYLIFEYCCHGDLLNFLKTNRENFHQTWSDVVKNNNFSFYHNFNQDATSSEGNGNDIRNSLSMPKNEDPESINYQQTLEVALSTGHDDMQGLDNAKELEYKNLGCYEEEEEGLKILTFEDLLCFSYQVAKGMEFLESKLCIHRDLAARNILVTHGKLAKICDFGLARDVINDPNYVVKGNARLPVKWMAPESIFEGIYTIKSDVWSFGILLWEIFSLGVNPYPGIPVNAHFYKLLRSGFQMDPPFYTTDEIYFLMQSCWAFDSRKRPSFPQLVSFLGYQISNTEATQMYQHMDQSRDMAILKKNTLNKVTSEELPLI